MNRPGRTRKKTMPRYGLVGRPKRSARNTTRNSTALEVTSAAPAIETVLRAKRSRDGIARLLLLQRDQVGHERVHIVLRQRVHLHCRFASGAGLRGHSLGIGDPRSDVIGRQLAANVIERSLGIAFPGNRVTQAALLIGEPLLSPGNFRVRRRSRRGGADTQRKGQDNRPHSSPPPLSTDGNPAMATVTRALSQRLCRGTRLANG